MFQRHEGPVKTQATTRRKKDVFSRGNGIAECKPVRIFIYVFMLTRRYTDKRIMSFTAIHANTKVVALAWTLARALNG
jgi:hypothetical protein